jgi:hypothetical protein
MFLLETHTAISQSKTNPAASAAPSLARFCLSACGVIISSEVPTSTPATHHPLPTNLSSAYSNAITPTFTQRCARDCGADRRQIDGLRVG